jgi:hypothetical protein
VPLSRSFTPMTSHTPASRAISPIRSVSALGTTTAWSAT